MPETNNWKFELEQYIRQSEPAKAENILSLNGKRNGRWEILIELPLK